MKTIFVRTAVILGIGSLLFVAFIGFSVWIAVTVSNAQGLPLCCAVPPAPQETTLNDDNFTLETLTYTDLATGQEMSFSDYTEPFLLVFFATWCSSCGEEAPVLRGLEASGVTILLLNTTDSQENAAAWVKTHAPDLAAGHLSQVQQLMQQMNIVSLPTTILFGSDLEEQTRWVGKTSLKTLKAGWEQHD
jgi:thiol-disulfide isomerase/thioredoxin